MKRIILVLSTIAIAIIAAFMITIMSGFREMMVINLRTESGRRGSTVVITHNGKFIQYEAERYSILDGNKEYRKSNKEIDIRLSDGQFCEIKKLAREIKKLEKLNTIPDRTSMTYIEILVEGKIIECLSTERSESIVRLGELLAEIRNGGVPV